jgi:Fe-S-cluster formation regulator IscX/YfhJ
MKIRIVVAKLFHVDGRTHRQIDMKKLIVAFRNFTNVPKKRSFFC